MTPNEALVISLLGQKGGAGKTTLAIHLAAAWAEEGRRVLLIDADPQATAATWAKVREGEAAFKVLALPGEKRLHDRLGSWAQGAEVVIIDTPGREDGVLRSAILASAAVILPARPSAADAWAMMDVTRRLAEARKLAGRAIPAAAALNAVRARSSLTDAAADALRQLGAPEGISLLETRIGDRVEFARALGDGRSVLETEPRGLAAEEVRAFAREVAMLAGLAEVARR